MSAPVEITIPDPADDRDEFKRRLEALFNREQASNVFINTALGALLRADAAEIARCRDKVNLAQERIDTYLSQWDAAPDRRGKEAVVASVRKE